LSERAAEYGVEVTDELVDLLDAIEADAYEEGKRDGLSAAEGMVDDALHEANLPALADDLTALVIEYVDRTGTALAAPDEHECGLIDVRDALLEAVAR
jgi:hypothetical protein